MEKASPSGDGSSPPESAERAGLSTAVDDTVKSFFEGLINGLKTELDAKIGDIKDELDDFGIELETKIGEIRDELRGSLHGVQVRIDEVTDELDAEKDKNKALEERVEELNEIKRSKYAVLQVEGKKRGWSVQVWAVEVGCRGFPAGSLQTFFKDLGLTGGGKR